MSGAHCVPGGSPVLAEVSDFFGNRCGQEGLPLLVLALVPTVGASLALRQGRNPLFPVALVTGL